MSQPPDPFAAMVAQVATAYFGNSPVAVSDIPLVIDNIARSLRAAEGRSEETAPAKPSDSALTASVLTSAEPAAVPPVSEEPRKAAPSEIARSIRDEELISFEDGRSYRILRPHLALRGLTPGEYREKWGLPEDYPMTAPGYSRQRAAIARRSGFGAKAAAPQAADGARAARSRGAARAKPASAAAPADARAEVAAAAGALTPRDIGRSIRDDGLVSFEDGRTYKMLKRHLSLRGLTPAQYRRKWGLPADYPMTAPGYSKQRSAIARRIGLGGAPARRGSGGAAS